MFKKFVLVALALPVLALAKGPGTGSAGVGVGGHGASGIAGPSIIDSKTGKEVTGGYVIKAGQCINLRNTNPVTMDLCVKAKAPVAG